MTDGDKVNASLRDFEKATGGTAENVAIKDI
jgi:hypothetical protein